MMDEAARWREIAALKRRAAWKVLDGGRAGLPRVLDEVQLEPRARPALRVLRGGRHDEPVRRVAIVVELPAPRSRRA